MKYLLILAVLSLILLPVRAQENDGGLVESLSLEEIRSKQQQLANLEKVEIRYSDNQLRSTSSLEGVPNSLSGLRVRSSRDLLSILDQLYVIYGFYRGEMLVHDRVLRFQDEVIYRFLEQINGIGLNSSLDIYVDEKTGLIKRLSGWLVLNRDFASAHMYSESEAIDAVFQFAENNGKAGLYREGGNHFAELMYREWGDELGLSPWWAVSIEYAGDEAVFDTFLIDPDGRVSVGARFIVPASSAL